MGKNQEGNQDKWILTKYNIKINLINDLTGFISQLPEDNTHKKSLQLNVHLPSVLQNAVKKNNGEYFSQVG